MITLGLTGNIGSGKSLAAAYLAELGAAVIDADKVGHMIIQKGQKAYEPLLAAFGSTFLNPDGEFDRAALGAYVFSDNSGEKRHLLNSITHPLIRDEIQEQLAAIEKQGYPLAVIEAALLFEAKMTVLMDKVWLISAPRADLISRVVLRDSMAAEAVNDRLNAQMSDEDMRKLADLIIVNDSSIEDFREKIRQEYYILLKENS